MHLASGPVTPADAANTARAAKAAFEAGLKIANLTKIANVIEGKAMNGDLQAARMLMDYFGVTAPEPLADEEGNERTGRPVSVTQVNVDCTRPEQVEVMKPRVLKGRKSS